MSLFFTFLCIPVTEVFFFGWGWEIRTCVCILGQWAEEMHKIGAFVINMFFFLDHANAAGKQAAVHPSSPDTDATLSYIPSLSLSLNLLLNLLLNLPLPRLRLLRLLRRNRHPRQRVPRIHRPRRHDSQERQRRAREANVDCVFQV